MQRWKIVKRRGTGVDHTHKVKIFKETCRKCQTRKMECKESIQWWAKKNTLKEFRPLRWTTGERMLWNWTLEGPLQSSKSTKKHSNLILHSLWKDLGDQPTEDKTMTTKIKLQTIPDPKKDSVSLWSTSSNKLSTLMEWKPKTSLFLCLQGRKKYNFYRSMIFSGTGWGKWLKMYQD